jgi:hypothetical protein
MPRPSVSGENPREICLEEGGKVEVTVLRGDSLANEGFKREPGVRQWGGNSTDITPIQ